MTIPVSRSIQPVTRSEIQSKHQSEPIEAADDGRGSAFERLLETPSLAVRRRDFEPSNSAGPDAGTGGVVVSARLPSRFQPGLEQPLSGWLSMESRGIEPAGLELEPGQGQPVEVTSGWHPDAGFHQAHLGPDFREDNAGDGRQVERGKSLGLAAKANAITTSDPHPEMPQIAMTAASAVQPDARLMSTVPGATTPGQVAHTLAQSLRKETHLKVAAMSTGHNRESFDSLAAEGGEVFRGIVAKQEGGASGGNGDTPVSGAASADRPVSDRRPAVDGSAGSMMAQIADQLAQAWPPVAAGSKRVSDFAPASVPTPSVSPADASDIVRTLRFELNPGELGGVTVRLSLGNNALRLHLSFSADRAADLARADQKALLQTLSDTGMTIASLMIDGGSAGKPDQVFSQDSGTGLNSMPGGGAGSADGGTDRHDSESHHRERGEVERQDRDNSNRGPADERQGVYI